MDKRRRHRAIIEIISANAIQTQADLAEWLRRGGFAVTQATVSRDIAELGLQKTRGAQGLVYQWQEPQGERAGRLARIMREFVLSVEQAENLLVIKTRPGAAPTVAASLDEARLETVVGTIAGDDTILIIVKSAEFAGAVGARLEKMLEKV